MIINTSADHAVVLTIDLADHKDIPGVGGHLSRLGLVLAGAHPRLGVLGAVEVGKHREVRHVGGVRMLGREPLVDHDATGREDRGGGG